MRLDAERYDRITTLGLFVIVGAGLLFENFPRFHWLFGAIAIAAGLVSIGTYFYNLSEPRSVAKCEDEQTAELAAAAEPILVRLDKELSETAAENLQGIGMLRLQGGFNVIYSGSQQKTEYFEKGTFAAVHPRRHDYLRDVVALVESLTNTASEKEPTFEFEFTRAGSLRIVPMKGVVLKLDKFGNLITNFTSTKRSAEEAPQQKQGELIATASKPN